MKRLVVVSNRVAMPDKSGAGGLAVGLEAALSEVGGIWFGWSGSVSENPPASPAVIEHLTEADQSRQLFRAVS